MSSFARRTTLAKVTEQQQIDQRISELKADIGKLQARRNTLSTISALPPEILARIFVQGKLSADLQDDRRHTPDPDKNWLNVSGVCRQWRNIVLDTPRMWSSINMHEDEEQVTEKLRRSKAAPLDIKYVTKYVGFTDDAAIAELTMSHIKRIRTLQLKAGTPEFLVKFLRFHLGTSASQLEELCLESGPYNLPQDVFQRSMPSLRVLSLTSVSLASPLPPLLRLTHLEFIDHSEGTQGLSASLFMSSLPNIPNIEEIRISNLLPAVDVEVVPFSLQQLRQVDFTSSHIDSLKIFDQFHPTSSSIAYTLDPQALIAGIDLSRLKRLCSRYKTGPSAVEICDLELAMYYPEAFELTAWNIDAPYQSLSISLPSPTHTPFDDLLELCFALPVASVRLLSLTGFDDAVVSTEAWTRLLSPLQRLETLSINSDRVGIFASLQSDEAADGPLLPKLAYINVANCRFRPHSEGLLSTLVKLLQDRIRLNMRIRSLLIEDCYGVTEGVVADLKKYVDVKWDGCAPPLSSGGESQ